MDKAVQANAEAMGQALQQVEQMEKAATRGQPVSRRLLEPPVCQPAAIPVLQRREWSGREFRGLADAGDLREEACIPGTDLGTVRGRPPFPGLVPQTGNYGDDSKGRAAATIGEPAGGASRHCTRPSPPPPPSRTSFAGERQGGMQTGRIMLGVGVKLGRWGRRRHAPFQGGAEGQRPRAISTRLAAQQQGGWESSGPDANAQGGGIRAGLAGAWFGARANQQGSPFQPQQALAPAYPSSTPAPPAQAPPPPQATGLASLDFELREQGQLYSLVAPAGKPKYRRADSRAKP